MRWWMERKAERKENWHCTTIYRSSAELWTHQRLVCVLAWPHARRTELLQRTYLFSALAVSFGQKKTNVFKVFKPDSWMKSSFDRLRILSAVHAKQKSTFVRDVHFSNTNTSRTENNNHRRSRQKEPRPVSARCLGGSTKLPTSGAWGFAGHVTPQFSAAVRMRGLTRLQPRLTPALHTAWLPIGAAPRRKSFYQIALGRGGGI